MPFREEIVFGVSDPEAPQIYEPDLIEDIVERDTKFQDFNDSQKNAFIHTFQNRVAMIQGPPGTGKTHIGVAIAETIILASNKSCSILVVCHTNHALDSFLEGLLDAGIKGIVRVGGRSKSNRLSEYQLFNLTEDSRFDRFQNRRYAQLKQEIEDAQTTIKYLDKQCSFEIGEKWWKTVSEHLEDEHHNAWEQLRIPAEAGNDGFAGGAREPDYLWKRWLKGKDPSPYNEKKGLSLWKLKKEDRVKRKLEWQSEIFESSRREYASKLRSIQEAKDEIYMLRNETKDAVLACAKVIGCTTTKAAMMR